MCLNSPKLPPRSPAPLIALWGAGHFNPTGPSPPLYFCACWYPRRRAFNDNVRPSVDTYTRRQIREQLDGPQAPDMKDLAAEYGVSVYIIRSIRDDEALTKVRCPTCGGLVWLPCVYCRAVRLRKVNPKPNVADPLPRLDPQVERDNAATRWSRLLEHGDTGLTPPDPHER